MKHSELTKALLHMLTSSPIPSHLNLRQILAQHFNAFSSSTFRHFYSSTFHKEPSKLTKIMSTSSSGFRIRSMGGEMKAGKSGISWNHENKMTRNRASRL